jgi:hypothetical protein
MGACEQFDRLTQVQLTSSKRPSIFNCHAGMPWPVSKFGGSAVPDADVSDCHPCPEEVCDRKRRSVRVVCSGIVVRHSPSRNKLILTEAVLPRASCTSAFFRMIVQSNFFSMSCNSWYIRESTDNCGSDRMEVGKLRSLGFLFLKYHTRNRRRQTCQSQGYEANEVRTLGVSDLEDSLSRDFGRTI